MYQTHHSAVHRRRSFPARPLLTREVHNNSLLSCVAVCSTGVQYWCCIMLQGVGGNVAANTAGVRATPLREAAVFAQSSVYKGKHLDTLPTFDSSQCSKHDPKQETRLIDAPSRWHR